MIPQNYPICFRTSCTKSSQCLRHQLVAQLPDGTTTGPAVYPTCPDGEDCPHYRPCRTIRMAYGFESIYTPVRHVDYTAMRRQLIRLLHGNGQYYLYKHGQKPLTPEQQQAINDLFAQYGYDTPVAFDSYEDIPDY